MVWVHQLRRPANAPMDGSHFMGCPKGRTYFVEMMWDAEMGCFLTIDFGLVDQLASWYPMPEQENEGAENGQQ